MKRAPRWLWLGAALAALLWWSLSGRPVAHAPGILAAVPPLQGTLDRAPTLPGRAGATLRPLATFSLTARVLGRADYRWDAQAALVPTDLALGWGRMSDSAVLDRIDISQSGRFYFWSADELPIPRNEITESSANMHLIPADDTIARAIRRVRSGDLVTFSGYLVEADWPDGRKWRSSLTRSDSGDGACELVFVEDFSIAPR